MRPGWLYGWKDIGAYIGCCARTAYIYHKKLNLPIERIPTGTIAADPLKINDWMRSHKNSTKII